MQPMRFLAGLAVAAAMVLPAWSAPAAARPNVLFIVVDDLNTALGCYGNATVKSPNIDRLAARGVRFDRAYAQYPLCNPSRVSFLSGRRPEATGVYVLSTSARTALPQAVMLPQFFREHGYFTAGAGKVYHSVKMSDPKSWDIYEDGAGEDPQEQAAIKSRYGGGDGRPAWHELDGDGSKMRDGVNARTILRLMREQHAAGKPFFLAAGFHKPHLPWTAPKSFFALYPEKAIPVPAEPAMRDVPPIALQTELSGFEQPATRAGALRGYYACISFTDHQIGLLLDQLEELHLWSTTLVVLVGDNGFHLGDHAGLWSKLSAFDAATRVPLIFAGAGVPAGRVVTSPVALLDIYPSILDLCGQTPAGTLDGRSLRPAMEAGAGDASRVVSSLVYHYDVAGRRDVPGRTVVGNNWRYTEWDGGKAGREFYLRTQDPGEYRNRVNEPEQAAAVRAAETALAAIPAPKPGPANRPRALAPADSPK
jgi:iduronate 2-sulfatase